MSLRFRLAVSQNGSQKLCFFRDSTIYGRTKIPYLEIDTPWLRQIGSIGFSRLQQENLVFSDGGMSRFPIDGADTPCLSYSCNRCGA
jgi:hypothetical protein